MLPEVDDELRTLLRAKMTTLGAGTPAGVTSGQVSFHPPDGEWASDVKGLAPKKAVNVYLAEVRENRALRSNERLERHLSGAVFRDPAPMQADCHYLISAWSGATDRRARTLEEHRILAEVLQVLVSVGGLTVNGIELPTMVAPHEGFPKLAEFWGTMGEHHRWRPVVQLVVTIPVQATTELAGTEVTTRLTDYGDTSNAAAGELLVQIAGVITDRSLTPPILVPRAWVRLETPTGAPLATTTSDARGRFTFLELSPGSYHLRVRAEGRDEPPVTPITVPSASGRYDLEFPP